MTKKILSSMAAASILTTAVIADTNAGNVLIFPAYFVGGGWQTSIKLVNTSDTVASVAKAVLYRASDSTEVKDFNIYLSQNDVAEFTIKEDAGTYKITSTDSSFAANALVSSGAAGMASATNLFSTTITEPVGYVVVYEMAESNATTAAYTRYHSGHHNLRADYDAKAAAERNISGSRIFSNGVLSGHANDQIVKCTSTGGTLFNGPATTRNIFGYVRITDTVNGKDMIAQPTTLNTDLNVTGNSTNSVCSYWVEGEAANIGQYFNAEGNYTVGGTVYVTEMNTTAITNAANKLTAISDIYMTFGESSTFTDSQLLVTQPLRKVAMDVNASAAKIPLTGYGFLANGSIKALAKIYNNDEIMASAGQFSPAQTPTLTWTRELSASEGNSDSANNLSTYLTQSGYTAGYVNLTFLNANNTTVTGTEMPKAIVSQMMATTAGGKVVTNWFTPETK
jgi:hypothetical protein